MTSAYHTPDLFTTYMDVQYAGIYAAPLPPLLLSRGNPSMKSEEVRSAEVGYRGHAWRWLGGYPDACTLMLVPDAGLVEVEEDAPVTGIDIQLFDGQGMSDPCFAALGGQP